MREGSWRDQWEDGATAELEHFRAMSLDDLLARVRRGRFGEYHVIWDAIAEKRDVRRAGWVLYDVVKSSADYLHRYHAARGLLALLECTRYEPADLTVAHRNPATALAEVEAMLVRAAGAREG